MLSRAVGFGAFEKINFAGEFTVSRNAFCLKGSMSHSSLAIVVEFQGSSK